MLKTEKDYGISPIRQLKADLTKDHFVLIATDKKFSQKALEALNEGNIVFHQNLTATGSSNKKNVSSLSFHHIIQGSGAKWWNTTTH